jgi:3' terminal RNA ribose 2'-O-methyltransferase Hen1
MLLTITTTHQPATDLGYLLHKHPDRCQTFKLPFGVARVFYTEATEERCTAALVIDMDAIDLNRRRARGFGWEQYVNDRPYVASSFSSVAITRVLRSALKGTCEERPDLVKQPIPLHATISALPCRGGVHLIHDLFAPLGYDVSAESRPLDSQFPDWGDSDYHAVSLQGTLRLCDLLTHLYVLIPVLDDAKHYFVDEQEIEKLLSRGEPWLGSHPERDLIVDRYLKHQRQLRDEALDRLLVEGPQETDDGRESRERVIESELKLHEHRTRAVVAEVEATGAAEVLDLGCGEGDLLKTLLQGTGITRLVGMDVSHRSLERAARRLDLDRINSGQSRRVELFQGSLTYRDARLNGFEAAVLVEVMEHIDPSRLSAFERVVFEFARPRTVIVTTPNADYNVRWPTLDAGRFRHADHRFEWGRATFQEWGDRVSDRFGYRVRYVPIGEVDDEVGAPTQMGVFTIEEGS